MSFKSAPIFDDLSARIAALPAAERSGLVQKVKGIFHFVLKSGDAEQTWTLDFKNDGSVAKGANGKADVTLSMSDDTFADLVAGKINGQKAFMQGKMKVKGNIALASKIDTVLKSAPKAAAAPAAAASVAVAGFESSAVFTEIANGLASASPAERTAVVGKVKAIFQFDVKNADGKVQTWALDLKTGNGSITAAPPAGKADVTIAIGDKDFVDLSSGKLNAQKGFMQGKIKVKGAVMLAAKLDTVLKDLRPKAKL